MPTDLLAENTARLNTLLDSLSMEAAEQWSGGEHIERSFDRWSISRKNKTLKDIIHRMNEQYVASLSADFKTLSVNPDGPLTLDECRGLAQVVGQEFGTEVELVMQMSSQGGR